MVNEGTYTFGYDSLGRNSSLSYPDGHQRIQPYDPEGRDQLPLLPVRQRRAEALLHCDVRCGRQPDDDDRSRGDRHVHYDSLNRVTGVTRQVSAKQT